jgi:Flp pilus assembly pilin Flp
MCASRRKELGQGLVEYTLILVLIAVVVISVLIQLGTKTSLVFSKVECTLAGRPAAPATPATHKGMAAASGTTRRPRAGAERLRHNA